MATRSEVSIKFWFSVDDGDVQTRVVKLDWPDAAPLCDAVDEAAESLPRGAEILDSAAL